jgi:hypothetical protein
VPTLLRGGSIAPYQRRTAPAVTRRSTRLTGVAPRDYSEGDTILGGASGAVARELAEAPRNPEVYTAVHEAALGTSTTPWTLFTDGYDAKGNRVYDPVRGACCHQCRQKTVCKHTSCSGCGQLRGRVSCHSRVVTPGLSLPGVTRLAWNIPAVINWMCFDHTHY